MRIIPESVMNVRPGLSQRPLISMDIDLR